MSALFDVILEETSLVLGMLLGCVSSTREGSYRMTFEGRLALWLLLFFGPLPQTSIQNPTAKIHANANGVSTFHERYMS